MSSGQSVTPGIRRAGTPRDIREAFRRIEELERVPTVLPDDVPDPVVYSLEGPRGIIVSVTGHPTTADISEPLDWTAGTGGAITSNDEIAGPINGDMDARTDPFFGVCYEIDWGTEPTFGVRIVRQGVYHVQGFVTFGITQPPGYPTMPPYTQVFLINGVGNSALVSRYVPDQTFWQDQWAGVPTLDQQHIVSLSEADASTGIDIILGAFTDMSGWNGLSAFLEVWRLGDWDGLDSEVST